MMDGVFVTVCKATQPKIKNSVWFWWFRYEMSTDDDDDVRAEHFCLQMSFAVVVFVAFTFSFRSVVWSAHRFAIIKSTNAFEYLLFECHSIFPTASNWKFQLNYQNFYFLIISKWQSKSLSDCKVKKRTRFKIICGFCKYDLI